MTTEDRSVDGTVDTTKRDLSELDRQIDNAEAHANDPNAPGRGWDQGGWVHFPDDPAQRSLTYKPCGSYGCLAGNTGFDAGFILSSGGGIQGAMPGTLADDMLQERVNHRASKAYWHVAEAAQDLLGLTEIEAQKLFNALNTIEDLREIQQMLHNGESVAGFQNRAYRNNDSEDEA